MLKQMLCRNCRRENFFSLKATRLFFKNEVPSENKSISPEQEMQVAVDRIEYEIFDKAGENIPLEKAENNAKSDITNIAQNAIHKNKDTEFQKEIQKAKLTHFAKIEENRLKYEQLKALAIAGVMFKTKGEKYEKEKEKMDPESVNPNNIVKLINWATELENNKKEAEAMPAQGHEEQKKNLLQYLEDTAKEFRKAADKIGDFWRKKHQDIEDTMQRMKKGESLTSYELDSMRDYATILKYVSADMAERMPNLKDFIVDVKKQQESIENLIKSNSALFEIARQMERTREVVKKYRKEADDSKVTPPRLQQIRQSLTIKSKELMTLKVPETLQKDKESLVQKIAELQKLIEDKLKQPSDNPNQSGSNISVSLQ